MMLDLGVLLPQSRYRRLLDGRLDAFRADALKHQRSAGVRLLFAPPTQLIRADGKARVALATPDGWREEVVGTPPRVFYNLLVRPVPPEARALRDLNGNPQLVVFNETNRWHRGMLADILAAFPETRSLVPPTEPFAGQAPGPGLALIVPTRACPRDGGLLVEAGIGGRLHYTSLADGRTGTHLLRDWTGGGTVATGLPLRKGGLLLQYLSGSPVGPEGPVEWRFYLHRGEGGAWQLAGDVAKRDLLRLGARRTRCWKLEEALALTFGSEAPDLAARLRTLALTVMEVLTLFLPGIAHAAVDFWLDQDGRPTLADLAGRFRTDWLRRAGHLDACRRLAEHPVRFAQLLARTGVEKLHVDFGRAGRL